MVVYGLAGLLF